MMSRVREEFLVTGAEAPLIGTLAVGEARGDTVVVLLNAGLLGREGPDRLHTLLARRFAARGYPTLRLDFSGVGDSPPRRDRVAIEEARVRETRSALDGLRDALGIDRFVLMGICLGADHAYEAALADERVRGLLLLDGYPYRTAGWWLRHYGAAALRLSSWRTLLRRGFAPPRAPGDASPEDAPAGGWAGVARRIPSRRELARTLRELIGRGTELYFIYTGGFRDWVNHAGQLRAAVPWVRFRGRVRVAYLPGADHVFRAASSREELTDRAIAWLEDRFPNA